MNVAKNRHTNLDSQYDVVIVGGGIYGAATAWEATSRGFKTLLVERDDFGSQTSANSLKTIHGGLRYLQNLDIKRLRQSANERARLQLIAPHIVTPLECLMPTYRGLARSRLIMRAGLVAHQLFSLGCNRYLANWQQPPSGGTMSRKSLADHLPIPKGEYVTGAASWYDAQAFNTERLVFSFVMSAINAGAKALNHTEATELYVDADKISGIRLHDRLTGDFSEIKTTAVIDCTGHGQLTSDWYGSATLTGETHPKRLRAWNVIVKRPHAQVAVGFKTLVGEQAGDHGRLLFAAPWRQGSIIGTWYDDGKPEDGPVSKDKIIQSLAEVNSVFPKLDYKLEDVTRIHTGWLPATSDPEKRSELVLDSQPLISHANKHNGPKGLILVQGVKYTTARGVAENVINQLQKRLKIKQLKPSISNRTQLYGAECGDFKTYSDNVSKKVKEDFSPKTIGHLLHNYGCLTDQILEMVRDQPDLGKFIPGQDTAIRAEVDFVIKNEFTYTLSDLLLRRTDIGSFQCPAKEVINYCSDRLEKAYRWSIEERNENITELLRNYPLWKNK